MYANYLQIDRMMSLSEKIGERFLRFVELGKSKIDDFLSSSGDVLCVKLDYCKHKQKFESMDVLAIASYLCPYLQIMSETQLIPIWMPSPILAAIIANLGLSKICKCGEIKS